MQDGFTRYCAMLALELYKAHIQAGREKIGDK